VENLKADFSSQYKPRIRWLPEVEYQKLESELHPSRRKHVRFFVLTGACYGEAERVARTDVDLHSGVLRLPGTKRETCDRRLPFNALPGLEELLQDILGELPQGRKRLFARWSNMRRDLRDACERAGIEPVSPNDLRRTFASWLKNRGLDSAVIARLMGHSSTRNPRRHHTEAKNPSHIRDRGLCAQARNRTTDTGIFSPLLYRLSYLGISYLVFTADDNPISEITREITKASARKPSTSPHWARQHFCVFLGAQRPPRRPFVERSIPRPG